MNAYMNTNVHNYYTLHVHYTIYIFMLFEIIVILYYTQKLHAPKSPLQFMERFTLLVITLEIMLFTAAPMDTVS